ncbi:hypothetical protein [Streptomyces sp. NPDC005548]
MIENIAIVALLVVASLRLYVPPKTAKNALFAALLLLTAALITFTAGGS